MNKNLTMPNGRHLPFLARVFAALVMTGTALCATATEAPSAGDGWQVLSVSEPLPASGMKTASVSAPASGPVSTDADRLAVTPVVLPGLSAGQGIASSLTFAISPQDVNLRNALDRWLQSQGWQLAWKIDDDLPLEFNASFTGDFTSVLTQVMQATNHMRTPTRVCRHTNHVIRVVARAASCKD